MSAGHGGLPIGRVISRRLVEGLRHRQSRVPILLDL